MKRALTALLLAASQALAADDPQKTIEALQVALQQSQAQTAQAIFDNLTPAAQALLQDSFETGIDLPSSVRRQIEMTAEKYGISQYEALRLLGVEMQP